MDGSNKERNRKILISNLSGKINLEGMKKELFYSQNFKVSSVSLTGSTAYVTLANNSEAKRAAKLINGQLYRGKRISVTLASSSSNNNNTNTGILVVGNLPFEFNEEKFRELMSPHGEIRRLFLVRNRTTGRSKGYGFVIYADKNSATSAKEHFTTTDAKFLQNRIIRVDIASPNLLNSQEQHSKTLFVDHLPKAFDDDRYLRGLFSKTGMVTFCKVATNPTTGKPKGFAFVDYKTVEEAEQSQEYHNGAMIGDSNIRVTFCTPGKSARDIFGKFDDTIMNSWDIGPGPNGNAPFFDRFTIGARPHGPRMPQLGLGNSRPILPMDRLHRSVRPPMMAPGHLRGPRPFRHPGPGGLLPGGPRGPGGLPPTGLPSGGPLGRMLGAELGMPRPRFAIRPNLVEPPGLGPRLRVPITRGPGVPRPTRPKSQHDYSSRKSNLKSVSTSSGKTKASTSTSSKAKPVVKPKEKPKETAKETDKEKEEKKKNDGENNEKQKEKDNKQKEKDKSDLSKEEKVEVKEPSDSVSLSDLQKLGASALAAAMNQPDTGSVKVLQPVVFMDPEQFKQFQDFQQFLQKQKELSGSGTVSIEELAKMQAAKQEQEQKEYQATQEAAKDEPPVKKPAMEEELKEETRKPKTTKPETPKAETPKAEPKPVTKQTPKETSGHRSTSHTSKESSSRSSAPQKQSQKDSYSSRSASSHHQGHTSKETASRSSTPQSQKQQQQPQRQQQELDQRQQQQKQRQQQLKKQQQKPSPPQQKQPQEQKQQQRQKPSTQQQKPSQQQQHEAEERFSRRTPVQRSTQQEEQARSHWSSQQRQYEPEQRTPKSSGTYERERNGDVYSDSSKVDERSSSNVAPLKPPPLQPPPQLPINPTLLEKLFKSTIGNSGYDQRRGSGGEHLHPRKMDTLEPNFGADVYGTPSPAREQSPQSGGRQQYHSAAEEKDHANVPKRSPVVDRDTTLREPPYSRSAPRYAGQSDSDYDKKDGPYSVAHADIQARRDTPATEIQSPYEPPKPSRDTMAPPAARNLRALRDAVASRDLRSFREMLPSQEPSRDLLPTREPPRGNPRDPPAPRDNLASRERSLRDLPPARDTLPAERDLRLREVARDSYMARMSPRASRDVPPVSGYDREMAIALREREAARLRALPEREALSPRYHPASDMSPRASREAVERARYERVLGEKYAPREEGYPSPRYEAAALDARYAARALPPREATMGSPARGPRGMHYPMEGPMSKRPRY